MRNIENKREPKYFNILLQSLNSFVLYSLSLKQNLCYNLYVLYKDLKKLYFSKFNLSVLFYLSISHDRVVLVFSNGITS